MAILLYGYMAKLFYGCMVIWLNYCNTKFMNRLIVE